ncbi:MAG: PD-(D/E)XK nuclease family protein [Paludibacteraceae bacterium]|nr:PD-(D/E)XK nuclease family protein [Paludibacteraceae bacterium]
MENSFLHRTAESIIDKLDWQQLSHTTLVLPSHRAGLVLKNELLQLQKEQNQKAVWAPDVKTLQQLQDALSPLYAEDELLTIVRLYKLYCKSPISNIQSPMQQIMSLDMFYAWGRQMLADFTNIDASMPAEEVPNFFDNTIAAHELSRWTLDPEVEERLKSLLKGDNTKDVQSSYVKEQYEQLWRNLHTLYDALRTEMNAEQKGYAGMRQRAVIEQWETDYIQSQIAGRTYVFVGFNYLLPVERELMEKLKDQALFFWDFVPDFQTNEKAFSFAKINSARLRNDNDQEPTAKSQQPITIMACVSKEAQAQYVHDWLKANYTEEGQKVGVVICDETMLESVIYTLPAITLGDKKTPEPINITKGFPLRNTAVYARVLDWLYDRRRGDVGQIVSPDFIDQIPITNSQQLIANSQQPIDWQELLILESEFQARKIVNQLRKIVTDGLGDIPFTLKLFRLLMRRVMESVTMPFHGEPVTDIQIMGVLETRLLDFDKLLLLNVEEGVIPQKQTDNSFIPYYLRKTYSMQTSDERATVYAYNFFRLLSRSGHSTLLFTTTDGGDSKGMSRFIMQILVSPEFTVEKAQLKEAGVIMPFDESRLGTSGVALKDTMHPPYSLSPSALNTYVECPRKFCFKYIQGLHEPDKEEEIFSSATMGTFVHNAMQYIYETHLNCKSGVETPVSPQSIEQILNDEACLKKALTEAYRKINEDWEKRHKGEAEHYKQEQHRHEEPTLLAYIRSILERDKQDAEVGLKMYILEKDRYFQVDVPQIGPVQTGGRIDRVDIYGPKGQEILRVVDYKTGKFETTVLSFRGTMSELMTKPDKRYIRQTLIYSHALMTTEQKHQQMPIEPNLYFCGHQLAGSKTALSINKMSDYKLMSDEVYEALTEKIQEIFTTTEFPPCDEKKCKPYCPFLALCRRKVEEHNRE